MRSKILVLSSVVALSLVLAPATVRAQRIVSGDCARREYYCSRYDDTRARVERAQARATERAAQAEARAEARMRVSRQLERRDYLRDERATRRFRERIQHDHALRMRSLRHRW